MAGLHFKLRMTEGGNVDKACLTFVWNCANTTLNFFVFLCQVQFARLSITSDILIFFSFLFFHRILALEKLGAVFNQVATPLQYTPRKFVIHPQSNNLIIIESDHNAFSDAVKEEKKQQIAEVCSKNFIIMMNSVTLQNYYLDFDLILWGEGTYWSLLLFSTCQEMVEAAGDDEKELAAQMAAEFLNEDLSEQQFGAPKAGPGMWASIVRMLDPIKVKRCGNVDNRIFLLVKSLFVLRWSVFLSWK